MNKCNLNFINKLNIDFSSIDTKIYSGFDINEIVSKYPFGSDKSTELVSIEDICGIYSRQYLPRKFPDVLDYFFDEKGDWYHTRAIDMLYYDTDNILEGLNDSFIYEPIVLFGIDNKYLVSTNGMHRFLILRLLYLSEKAKCKSEDELNNLKSKFVIPAKVSNNDLFKSYCSYLIDLFQPIRCGDVIGYEFSEVLSFFKKRSYEVKEYVSLDKFRVKKIDENELEKYKNIINSFSHDFNDNYDLTDKIRLKTCFNKEFVLNNLELLEFTKNVIITSNKINKNTMNELVYYLKKYDSFKTFYEKYFRDIIDFNNKGEIFDDCSKTK